MVILGDHVEKETFSEIGLLLLMNWREEEVFIDCWG